MESEGNGLGWEIGTVLRFDVVPVLGVFWGCLKEPL